MNKPIRIKDQGANIYVDISQNNQSRLTLRFATLHNEGFNTQININAPSDQFLRELGVAIQNLGLQKVV